MSNRKSNWTNTKNMRFLTEALHDEVQAHFGATITWWIGLILQGICLCIFTFCKDPVKVCHITPETGYECYGSGLIYPQIILAMLCIGICLWLIVCPVLKAREQERSKPRAPVQEKSAAEYHQLQLEYYRKPVRTILMTGKIIIMVPMLIISTLTVIPMFAYSFWITSGTSFAYLA
ncbi:MAG: hypothetical protein SO053_06225 [Bifidobacterium animalis]|nr:hypothetical protein [Bifidobacterium animalis]MDY5040731.1 hypothetical protein [Bifidobacterium animalis]